MTPELSKSFSFQNDVPSFPKFPIWFMPYSSHGGDVAAGATCEKNQVLGQLIDVLTASEEVLGTLLY